MFVTHVEPCITREMRNRVEELLTRYEDKTWRICGYCGGPAKEDSGEQTHICDVCLVRRHG